MNSRIELARNMRQRVNLGLSAAIESGAVNTENAQGIADEWRPGWSVVVGEPCAHGGKLYRCVQGHTTQAGWEPPNVPALWVDMGVSPDNPDAAPEWVQPTGAHDAYAKGSVVTHNGKTWASDIDANVYEPGVYGWTEATT